MENECVYKLKELQPSQFYISEKKLCDIESWFDPSDLSGFEPIPVKLLDGMPVMTDGHTRAVAALRAGLDAVPLVWDTDELDWDLYRFCVKECRKQNVLSPADLLDRIITADEYDEKWNKWCDIMHQQMHKIEVVQYTEERIPDVIEYELQLRAEESDWGWEINDEYKKAVKDSFKDKRFDNSLSLLAYVDGRVAGRIDAALIPSHFDGSVKAYLDWICVIKSYRQIGRAHV